MKQTFIIKTYGGGKYDFYRVGVKKLSTALKYLKGWRMQAEERNAQSLFANLCAEDATYKIIETPDGYNEGAVLASGLIAEL